MVDTKRLQALAAKLEDQKNIAAVLEGKVAALVAEQRQLKVEMLKTLEQIKGIEAGNRREVEAMHPGEHALAYGDVTQAILRLLGENRNKAWSNAEIAGQIDLAPPATINATLHRLRKAGRVRRVGPGKYRAASKSSG